VFTHVDVLREGGGVFVLGVLPLLFVVRRNNINGVGRLPRVAHVVQLGVIGLLLVRTLQHVVVLPAQQLIVDVH